MIVRPRTSTQTIRKIGRSGELRNWKYDGSTAGYGRSTLSILLANSFSEFSMFRPYEKMLKLFPDLEAVETGGDLQGDSDQLRRAERVRAGLRRFRWTLAAILATAKDFQNADCCYRLETAWDLWQYDEGWKRSRRR